MGIKIRRFKYDTNIYLEKCSPIRFMFPSSQHIPILWSIDIDSPSELAKGESRRTIVSMN